MNAKKRAQFIQYGYPVLTFLMLLVLVVAIIFYQTTPISLLLVAVIPMTIALLVLFKLTVTIDNRYLTWHFTFGFLKKAVPTTELVRTEVVKYPWYYGFGFRLTPHGVMYNVSGNHAVKIYQKNGTTFLLGSDNAEQLKMAIDQFAGLITSSHGERDQSLTTQK